MGDDYLDPEEDAESPFAGLSESEIDELEDGDLWDEENKEGEKEIMEEGKTRSDKELAELMYGKPEVSGEAGTPELEEPKARETEEPRSFDDLANVVYPEKNPQYADVDEDGYVSNVIRELVSGKILAQSRFSDRAALAASSSPLPNADLTGIKLAGKSLDHGNFHDSSIAGNDCEGMLAQWSDFRQVDATGANLSKANFGFADIRGMKVSPETNIAGANFTGAAIDQQTYDQLMNCKGVGSAKGLAIREMPKK